MELLHIESQIYQSIENKFNFFLKKLYLLVFYTQINKNYKS